MKKEKETKVEETQNETQEVKQEAQETQTEAQETETQEAEEINEWEKKYNNINDSYLRLMADFDNYRKRTIKEKADLIKNAGERIITDFLPIVDNFERALNSMKTAEDIEAVRQGVELIYNQIMSMMKANGVAVIETENAPFDTEYHEAITTIPAPTPELKDKIVDCTTKGYTMNEKVIRHAKVVVGN
ncbi:MAG: nucleotide exchange factor GrpE [Paludibacteraceae bacterium]|nr:nucleotide exchange factor GrpE [Paludibacteraceae bacterium]